MYYCPVCGKAFERSFALKTHFVKRHPEYFDMKVCPFCGKKIGGNHVLNNGLWRHLVSEARRRDEKHLILYALTTRKRYGRKFRHANNLRNTGLELLRDPKFCMCFRVRKNV